MSFGERLIRARKERKMSQELLAKKSGVSQSAISNIEKGLNSPSASTIEMLASALGYTSAEMLADDTSGLISGILPLPETHSIPLLGDIACGTPITAEENLDGYVNVPVDVMCHFALRCKGDSMSPRVQDGDLVYIRQQPDVEDGQIAAVLIDNEATLKHVYHISGGVQLVAENPAYPPMIYTGAACSEVRILGLAVAYQRMLV